MERFYEKLLIPLDAKNITEVKIQVALWIAMFSVVGGSLIVQLTAPELMDEPAINTLKALAKFIQSLFLP